MQKISILIISLTILNSCATIFHISPSKKINVIQFANMPRNEAYRFFYPNVENDTILQRLNIEYKIPELVAGSKNEYEKVLRVLNWVRQQWEHNGWNNAKTNNPIEILERVKKGEKFRCVEYGIVLRNCLNAIGLPARTLGLMTRDVEKTKYGAGHVLAEVWLNDYQKWVMVDAQFDAMPMLDNVPLNAVELQSVIIEKKSFKFVNLKGDFSKSETANYMRFIPHYLYYFNSPFDSRRVKTEDVYKVNNKTHLLLVPKNAKNPSVFQRVYPINYVEYTNNVADFYAKP
ncbi:MAG: transglutaminase-like domain-containing protein [Raineya sp.]|nr:transglutaminase-like domain-containing protein [Raineya sp.]